jgi:hypothetical protein
MLELGEDEGGAGYLCSAVGVGGDVLEGSPPLCEQGEPSFAAAAQVAQECVARARVGIEFLVPGGVLEGDEDSDSGALIAAVGEGRHSQAGGAVEAVPAGGGDVVDRAGLGGAGPEREAVRAGDGLCVAAVPAGLPEYQASICSPFTLVSGSEQRSDSKIFPSRITYGTPSAIARSSASARPGACSDSTSMASATYR